MGGNKKERQVFQFFETNTDSKLGPGNRNSFPFSTTLIDHTSVTVDGGSYVVTTAAVFEDQDGSSWMWVHQDELEAVADVETAKEYDLTGSSSADKMSPVEMAKGDSYRLVFTAHLTHPMADVEFEISEALGETVSIA